MDARLDAVDQQLLVLADLLLVTDKEVVHPHRDVAESGFLLGPVLDDPIVHRANQRLTDRAAFVIELAGRRQLGLRLLDVVRALAAEQHSAATGGGTDCDRNEGNERQNHVDLFLDVAESDTQVRQIGGLGRE